MSEFNSSFEGLSLSEMLALREQMDKQLNELARKERQEALAQVQQLIKQYDFMAFEVFARQEKPKAKVADKYYDPDTGQSWTGRGKPPRWIQGKDRDQFLIRNQAAPDTPLDPEEARQTGLLGAMAGAGVIRT